MGIARRIRLFWKRSTNRFLTVFVAFILCGWFSYYSLSRLVGPVTRDTDTRVVSIKVLGQTGQEQYVYARVPTENTKVQRLPLLGAEATTTLAQHQSPKSGLVNVPEAAKRVISQANQLERAGTPIEARRLATEFLKKYGDHDACEPIRKLAVELAKTTILSPKVFPGEDLAYIYSVKPGDTLGKLARKSRVPHQLLARINRIADPRKMRVGQKIKLLKGPIDAVIIKHKLLIYLTLQNVPIASYPIGLGKDNGTPEGTWRVDLRQKNPSYTNPDTRKFYGPNDPANPTGGYWIRLKGLTGQALGKTGFGIHGTIEPASIGKFVSKGCIRMHNRDVARVFEMLRSGASTVTTKP